MITSLSIHKLLLESNFFQTGYLEKNPEKEFYYSPYDLGEVGYLLAEYYYHQGVEFRETELIEEAKTLNNSQLEYWNLTPLLNNQTCFWQADLMKVIERVWYPLLIKYLKVNTAAPPEVKAAVPPSPNKISLAPLVAPPPLPKTSN